MKYQSGFTLIELLVVIAIIGVLTAVVLANMVGIRERSRDAAAKNDLKQFKTALRLYYNDMQSYPDDPASGNDCDNLSTVEDGAFESESGEVLMKDLSSLMELNCQYEQTNSGEGFLLSIELNNEGDPDAEASADRCDGPDVPGTYYECAD